MPSSSIFLCRGEPSRKVVVIHLHEMAWWRSWRSVSQACQCTSSPSTSSATRRVSCGEHHRQAATWPWMAILCRVKFWGTSVACLDLITFFMPGHPTLLQPGNRAPACWASWMGACSSGNGFVGHGLECSGAECLVKVKGSLPSILS